MPKKNYLAVGILALLVVLLFLTLYSPVRITIIVRRYWDNSTSRNFLRLIEKGELEGLAQKYQIKIFDNETINNLIKLIRTVKKPLLNLLLERKYSEKHLLNYTAVAKTGKIIVNATKQTALLHIQVQIDGESYRMFALPNGTLINVTGTIEFPFRDFNLSAYGYIVFMHLNYNYEAKMTYPLCNAKNEIQEQIIIFDYSGNIILVATFQETLIAR